MGKILTLRKYMNSPKTVLPSQHAFHGLSDNIRKIFVENCYHYVTNGLCTTILNAHIHDRGPLSTAKHIYSNIDTKKILLNI